MSGSHSSADLAPFEDKKTRATRDFPVHKCSCIHHACQPHPRSKHLTPSSRISAHHQPTIIQSQHHPDPPHAQHHNQRHFNSRPYSTSQDSRLLHGWQQRQPRTSRPPRLHAPRRSTLIHSTDNADSADTNSRRHAHAQHRCHADGNGWARYTDAVSEPSAARVAVHEVRYGQEAGDGDVGVDGW